MVRDQHGVEWQCSDPALIELKLCHFVPYTCWNLVLIRDEVKRTPTEVIAGGVVLATSRNKDRIRIIFENVMRNFEEKTDRILSTIEYLDQEEEDRLNDSNKYIVNGQEFVCTVRNRW